MLKYFHVEPVRFGETSRTAAFTDYTGCKQTVAIKFNVNEERRNVTKLVTTAPANGWRSRDS